MFRASDNATDLTVSQAARVLGSSSNTVRRWCDEARLPCKLTEGGHRRIPRAAVEALRVGRPWQEVVAC